jgi:nucleoside-diphosphate-sugar epimerase
MMSNRAIVTGAGGFIGKHMVRHLERAGADVQGWTRDICDLRDSGRVAETLNAFNPDLIFHLAAQPVGSGSESWQVIADEQNMLTNLVSVMPTHCRLICTGSMAEYGRSGIFDERACCWPDTAYGCAKLSSTTLALSARATLGLDIRVARLFGVFGAGEAEKRLLPSVIQCLDRGEPVRLSDGLQIRDFIHVDDVCEALLRLSSASDLALPIVNIGTGIGVTVRHVCEMAADLLGAERSLLQFGAIPRRSVDQDELVARTDQLALFMQPPPQRWASKELAKICVDELRAHR